MLPRRRFSKVDVAPAKEIVYFSYEASLASRRAARPKARHVVAAILAAAFSFWVALDVDALLHADGRFAVRVAELMAFAIGAMFVVPTFMALSGRNYVKVERGTGDATTRAPSDERR
jgi:hypothetical protein